MNIRNKQQNAMPSVTKGLLCRVINYRHKQTFVMATHSIIKPHLSQLSPNYYGQICKYLMGAPLLGQMLPVHCSFKILNWKNP